MRLFNFISQLKQVSVKMVEAAESAGYSLDRLDVENQTSIIQREDGSVNMTYSDGEIIITVELKVTRELSIKSIDVIEC